MEEEREQEREIDNETRKQFSRINEWRGGDSSNEPPPSATSLLIPPPEFTNSVHTRIQVLLGILHNDWGTRLHWDIDKTGQSERGRSIRKTLCLNNEMHLLLLFLCNYISLLQYKVTVITYSSIHLLCPTMNWLWTTGWLVLPLNATGLLYECAAEWRN